MQWGLAAVIVIGALIGAVMIPTAKRAEPLAARDVAAAGDGEIELSEEYRALVRRLSTVGTLLSLLVLVTILFMVCTPSPERQRLAAAGCRYPEEHEQRISSRGRRRHRPGRHADARAAARARASRRSEIVAFASERSVGRELEAG